MNDRRLETLLLASRPSEAGKYSDFTEATMAKIRHNATFSDGIRTTNTPTTWSVFIKRASAHKALAIVIAILALSLISFSGYAYANGTNPISLLRRWITGEEVHVMYEGREFKHSKSRTYSDAAVTAYAELTTIDGLVFKADNQYMVPKNGIEHVSNPYYHEFIEPWIGVVEQANGNTVTIHQQYLVGNKVVAAQNVDKRLTISLADINTYIEGEPVTADKMIGKLVVVHTRHYLRYYTGSKKTPQPVIHQYAFALNHTLENIKEADQASQPGENNQSEDKFGIYEASWGGEFSNLCGNNAANHCDPKIFMSDQGESFFSCTTGRMQPGTPCGGGAAADVVNPNSSPFGEAVPDSVARTAGILLRDVEGKVTTITDSSISIKTSSGQIWTLALTNDMREAFNKRTGKPLKVGERVGAAVISSVNDLDNRNFDNAHIYTMKRY